MRLWLNTLLRLGAGTYFVLTSLYCLLAFLPYTFYALIKAPAYAWMPWFVHHQAGLYWAAITAAVVANWRLEDSGERRSKSFLAGIGLLAVAGVYVTSRPFLPGLENNSAAYGWSLIAMAPLAAISLWRPHVPNDLSERSASGAWDRRFEGKLFAYSGGLLVALVVSLIYVAGARMRIYSDTRSLSFHPADAELAVWSFVSHCALAIAILSVLNLAFLLASKTARPRAVRRGMVGALVFAALWTALVRFLENAMSFEGWSAQVYAASLALTLTLWGFSSVRPFLERQGRALEEPGIRGGWLSSRAVAMWVVVAALTAVALASRSLIGGEDWNGIVESTWALVFWVAMSLCLYRLRPVRAKYSAAVVLGILLGSAFVYKGLQATEIFWGRPLGSTDDEISLKLEEYGGRDPSFQLAHHVLGNSRNQPCGDLCRILREYTNIRDNRVNAEVRLVDQLTPAQGQRPNIFIFVIDSMRPDYLGAYNPRQVNYTPNLDALARDSVVFKNAYSEYMGTTLSEPAIWTGSLLLHTHYPQPFAKINSLEKMARTDGYQSVISYDTVLSQLLSPDDDMIKLDAEKTLWNQYEACSTVEQLESVLDSRQDKARPVLFYAQPMNVHQFARNDVPSPTSQHWRSPAGMNSRITYEVHWVDSCLGGFFAYLKQRGLYDSSIIVVTSDHGDATGEFGRISHSTSIWPEIMRVPLIIHLPSKMREHLVYDDARLSTLTDIAPTLYYVLGHRPIRQNPLYGRPLFAETKEELDRYKEKDLLLASDVRAVYGILTADGRYLYTTYDSPAQSYLFDLAADPNAGHSILTPALKQRYDEEIIERLHVIGDYYGYKPGVGSLLASAGQ